MCGALGQQEVAFKGPEVRVPGNEEMLKLFLEDGYLCHW